MGIPVVYFGNPSDNRELLLKELGLTIYPINPKIHPILSKIFNFLKFSFVFDYIRNKRIKKLVKKIDWNVHPLDISIHKKRIIGQLKSKLDRKT